MVSSRNNTTVFQANRYENGRHQTTDIELIGEEPLMVRVEDKPYTVIMRTPGEEVSHAVGLCVGEGIVDSMDDFKTIGYDQNLEPNVIDIWLTPERREKIPGILARESYLSQTSCGICGKKMIEDLNQILLPAVDGFSLNIQQALESVGQLSKTQNVYPRTRGSHAALLFDERLGIISFAEDVGRHNALDKAIGKALMDNKLSGAKLLVLSSRISYELVQKAARARLPMIVSKSRPTALAVKMGQSLNMTLACAFGMTNLLILCGGHRITEN